MVCRLVHEVLEDPPNFSRSEPFNQNFKISSITVLECDAARSVLSEYTGDQTKTSQPGTGHHSSTRFERSQPPRSSGPRPPSSHVLLVSNCSEEHLRVTTTQRVSSLRVFEALLCNKNSFRVHFRLFDYHGKHLRRGQMDRAAQEMRAHQRERGKNAVRQGPRDSCGRRERAERG